jgi:hypothetical protein
MKAISVTNRPRRRKGRAPGNSATGSLKRFVMENGMKNIRMESAFSGERETARKSVTAAAKATAAVAERTTRTPTKRDSSTIAARSIPTAIAEPLWSVLPFITVL